jgi:hypothetical protein
MQLGHDDFYMFSVKYIEPFTQGRFLGFDELKQFSQHTGIKMVPILDIDPEISSTLEGLKTYTNQLKYTQIKHGSNPFFAEGIVMRPKDVVFAENLPQNFLSFKLINENYKINPKKLAK